MTDKKTGNYRLSMRALTEKPEGYVEREARPRLNHPSIKYHFLKNIPQ